MKKTTLAALLLCSTGLWSGSTLAAISCGLESVTGVAFGTYNPLLGAPNLSSGTFNVRCGRGYADGNYSRFYYAVTVGSGGSGNTAARKMSNGIDNLNYGLYQESGRLTNLTVVNGSFIFPFDIIGGVREGSILFNIYGRIPAGQLVSAGTYTDTITLTLTF